MQSYTQVHSDNTCNN